MRYIFPAPHINLYVKQHSREGPADIMEFGSSCVNLPLKTLYRTDPDDTSRYPVYSFPHFAKAVAEMMKESGDDQLEFVLGPEYEYFEPDESDFLHPPHRGAPWTMIFDSKGAKSDFLTLIHDLSVVYEIAEFNYDHDDDSDEQDESGFDFLKTFVRIAHFESLAERLPSSVRAAFKANDPRYMCSWTPGGSTYTCSADHSTSTHTWTCRTAFSAAAAAAKNAHPVLRGWPRRRTGWTGSCMKSDP